LHYISFFLFFSWENKCFKKNHTQITYLIKSTVLGRALWGC